MKALPPAILATMPKPLAEAWQVYLDADKAAGEAAVAARTAEATARAAPSYDAARLRDSIREGTAAPKPTVESSARKATEAKVRADAMKQVAAGALRDAERVAREVHAEWCDRLGTDLDTALTAAADAVAAAERAAAEAEWLGAAFGAVVLAGITEAGSDPIPTHLPQPVVSARLSACREELAGIEPAEIVGRIEKWRGRPVVSGTQRLLVPDPWRGDALTDVDSVVGA